MLTLAGDKACAITWFGDNSLFPASGWPDPAAHAATLNSAARPKMMLAASALPEASAASPGSTPLIAPDGGMLSLQI